MKVLAREKPDGQATYSLFETWPAQMIIDVSCAGGSITDLDWVGDALRVTILQGAKSGEATDEV